MFSKFIKKLIIFKIQLFIFPREARRNVKYMLWKQPYSHCKMNNWYYSTNFCHLLLMLNYIITSAVLVLAHVIQVMCHTVGACCQLSYICEQSATHCTVHSVRPQWWQPRASRGMTPKGCPGDWSRSHPVAASAVWRSWSHPQCRRNYPDWTLERQAERWERSQLCNAMVDGTCRSRNYSEKRNRFLLKL